MKQQLADIWWLILLSISSGVAGQTMIKLGVSQPGATEATSNLISLVALILRSPQILLGLVLYAMGALAWIAVLSKVNLSLAYPFLALNFVLIALVSYAFLGEAIPTMRWIGTLVLCVGILIVAQSSR
jgi:multidrug transporter EmrE-like cation transporter